MYLALLSYMYTHQKVSVPNRYLGMVISNPRQLLRRRNRFGTRRELRKRRRGISGEIPRVGARPGSTVPEARERFVGEDAHGGRFGGDRSVFALEPLTLTWRRVAVGILILG